MAYQHRVYREDGSFWVDLFKDDVTRTTITYAENGTILSTVPYTAAENQQADAEAAIIAAGAATAAARVVIKAIVTDLQAEKTRCDTVISKTNNQIGGADTKEVARASKRIADAAIDLARFVQDMS